MGFRCGIVGLPNVGKSTLFNALTATQAAEAANYPFCTIEPNVGRVGVPDTRLQDLATIAKSEKVLPTQLEFVDIAGLVRGASKGEGLGNQFLGHIREVDAIIHVLRCFDDPDITHVDTSIDPVRDAETVETELLLADLESIERRLAAAVKKARGADKEAKADVALMERVLTLLQDGKPASLIEAADADEATRLKNLQLLTFKPILYVGNVAEHDAANGNQWTKTVETMAAERGAKSLVVSAAIEAELTAIEDAEERAEYLEALGLSEPGLTRLIRTGYALLGLITFFTAGPKEARAWTVYNGATAPQAAGVIHTDFQRGFIRAETISYDDYVALGGEQPAKDAGKMRQEGKDYVVADGDVFHFRFNV